MFIVEHAKSERQGRIAEFQKRTKEGRLPDFVVIGAQKGGTGFCYRLLRAHPLVVRAAAKELHFFDENFEEGVSWYRRCFPEVERRDGRKILTGEATPFYLFGAQVPARMAEVVPGAKLIALLRNPVDRAYSQYQMLVRRGEEARSFEQATEEELATGGPPWYLGRGFYAEQLERFSFFAERDQLLVINSENLFTRRRTVLARLLRFLGLPPFKPAVAKQAGKKVVYEPMDPAMRRRLEGFFAPHNERLYDLLGTDFGW